MFDSYISLEQEKREQQELEAINELADRNTDLESSGHWDGWLNEPYKGRFFTFQAEIKTRETRKTRRTREKSLFFRSNDK